MPSNPLPDSELGARLRAAREARGWSQPQAAERLGMKQPQLSKLERGVNVPGGDVLQRVARAYEVPLAVLLGDPAQPPPALTFSEGVAAGRARERVAAALRYLDNVRAELTGALAADALGAFGHAPAGPPYSPVELSADEFSQIMRARAAAADREATPPRQVHGGST